MYSHRPANCNVDRFPRTRGDGPGVNLGSLIARKFPPHTRGWTVVIHRDQVRLVVSPAHAGMDLSFWRVRRFSRVSPAHAGMDPIRLRAEAPRGSFPRTRGDGPSQEAIDEIMPQFPPHTRGWTWPDKRKELLKLVSPRTRGMGPAIPTTANAARQFPPHTRGWTVAIGVDDRHFVVSPAHAGMDPPRRLARASCTRFPRTRGDGPSMYFSRERSDEFPPHTRDGPSRAQVRGARSRFPPHTRGWTIGRSSSWTSEPVSPAHAGMDPDPGSLDAMRFGFPRTRGDGPFLGTKGTWSRRFPPHTRGWTLDGVQAGAHNAVPPHTRGWTLHGPGA